MRRLGGPTALPDVPPCTCFIFLTAHLIRWTAKQQYAPRAAPLCSNLPFLWSYRSARSLCLFCQVYPTSLQLLLLTESFLWWPQFPPTIFSLLIKEMSFAPVFCCQNYT